MYALTVLPVDRTARMAGRRIGVTEVAGSLLLSQMGRMTVQIGHGALTEHDRLRNARQAGALARAAQEDAQ